MARPYRLDLGLDDESDVPLFLQLANGIAADIRRGRLRPGDPLPGSRSIAAHLGIARKTVVTALDELIAQGWVVASPARGTHVSDAIPLVAIGGARRGAMAPFAKQPAYTLRTRSPDAPELPRAERATITFDDGTPDARLAPIDALAAAYRRAAKQLARSGMGYGDPRGDAKLRDVIAAHLNQVRGLAVRRENVLVTRGSQMAIALAALVVAGPGDSIALEHPGYAPAHQAFELSGAAVHPVPTDEKGLSVAHLRKLLARVDLRAVYVTPQHQYPTGVAMSACRRTGLLDLALERRFAIIEDDYDYEFFFGTRPPLALASVDGGRSVLYVGSISKLLAPTLRVGYLVGPESVVDRAAAVRASLDRQGDAVLERAIAELFEDGSIHRHARKARLLYVERRDALAGALRARLGDVLAFDVPDGGLALFARPRASMNLAGWCARARKRGVNVLSVSEGGIRLGFAALTPAEIREGVDRLARAL